MGKDELVVALVFWTSLSIILMTYIGYPLMLYLICAFKNKNKNVNIKEKHIEPTVALLISAYNEEKIIEEKLKNCLKLNYDTKKLEIIVISDGSTDNTDNLVKEYKNLGIRLIRIDGRMGKTECLNRVVPTLKQDIILFSDANSLYEKAAIKHLVKHFKEKSVGGVSGELRYIKNNKNNVSLCEGLYWKYEQYIKKMESQIYSVVGANGAIYAIRKELHQKLDKNSQNDLQHPFYVIRSGKIMLYEPKAVAFESTSDSTEGEFKRKVRIGVRGINGIINNLDLLNVFRYKFYSLELFFHRVLRWIGFVFVITLFFSNLFLCNNSLVYQVSLLAQVLLYILSFTGYVMDRKKKKVSPLVNVFYYFVLLNIASLLAVIAVMRGQIMPTWTPTSQSQRSKK